MIIPFQVKLIAYGILTLGLLGAGGYAVYKYEDMSKTILEQKQQVTILQKANTDQAAVIVQRKLDLAQSQQDYSQLQGRLETNALQLASLQKKFKTTNNALGTKDISMLAAAKPGLVQDIVNRGTTDVIHCFEIVTGAPANEKVPNCDAVDSPAIGVQPVPDKASSK
jgi:hypothetical protein